MSLTLKIISPTNMPVGQLPEFTFDELGGSIGRKPNNDFILIDPERFISSQHANITFQNGDFLITDTSTNGVFINNAKRPIGTGSSQVLSDSDKISIGEFQLEVTLTNALKKNTAEPAIAAPAASSALFDLNEPLIQDNTSNLDSIDPLALLGDASPANAAGGSDFFTPQTSSFSTPQDSDFLSSSPADSSNDFFGDILDNPHQNIPEPLPINEPFSPPSAIPDDWDIMGDDLLSPSPNTPTNNVNQGTSDNALFQKATTPPTSNNDNLFSDSGFPETQIENTAPLIPESDSLLDNDDIFASLTASAQPLQTPPNATAQNAGVQNTGTQSAGMQNTATQNPPQASAATAPPPTNPATHFSANAPTQNHAVNTNQELVNAFIIGAGLNPAQVNTDNPVELLTKLGQLTRISTEGLMMALRARATIKSGFRVNKTIIAPIENNPLKFSVTSEDALSIIFAEEKAGYMPATEAFSEGFKDLQTHQMAMMAGMQAIIKEITTQFSPQTLERKFEPQKSGNSFMPGNKKAKNWEMYEIFYKKMTETLQDDFQNVYGEEFARAYENQVRKLM